MYRLIRFFLIFFILILFFSENSHSGLVKLNPIKVIDKNSKDDSDNGNFFDFGSLKPSSDETSVLTVILNDQNRGEYFVKLAQDGDILFPSDNLKNLGFKEIPAKAVLSEKGYVSLKSLFPEIRFETDEKTLTVTITADPQLLETSRISLVRLKPLEVVYTENSSAFLNYSAGYTFDNKYNVNMLNIPIETGIRIGDYLALSEFSYTRSGTDSEFIRLMTSITGDDPLRLRRYIFGDFIADSGTMGSSSILGGLSISKNFSLSPYFIRFPEAELSGIIQSPSDVEVYVNGSLIQKTHLSPGEFELFNLPVTSGAGDVTLIIRDAYGREKRVVYPFYASSALLKPGLHEYSYNVGFKREGLGEKNFEYRDPAFTGFHRLGISETFTAGLRFEADCDTLSFGTSAVFLPG